MTQSDLGSPRGQHDAIAQVHSLLSRWWIRELDQEALTQLRSTRLRPAMASLGFHQVDEEIDELATEYCRLFIGPRDHLLPFQSVWVRSELRTELTESTQKFADLIGFRVPSGIMADHLGVQLAIMSKLITLAGRDGGQSVYREIAIEFSQRHLQWPELFLSRVATKTVSPFYRDLAKMTMEFLASDVTTEAMSVD